MHNIRKRMQQKEDDDNRSDGAKDNDPKEGEADNKGEAVRNGDAGIDPIAEFASKQHVFAEGTYSETSIKCGN